MVTSVAQSTLLTQTELSPDSAACLDLINRYHLFSRIKERAGAPTRDKLEEVRARH